MKLNFIAAFSAVLMFTGCAGSFSPTIKGSAQEISRAKGESLPGGWGTSGMVITVVHDFSSELRETSNYVYRAAAEERRDIRISLASEESSKNLGGEGLAALSTSSGSRYVLKPAVKSSTEDRSTLVEVSAQLVDSKSGETVWEGKGVAKGSHTITSVFGYHNLSVSKTSLLKEAALQLVKSLPR